MVKLDQDDERMKEFVVTLKRVAMFNINTSNLREILCDASLSMPMLQALDVILRHLPSLKMEPIGRSFFSKPNHPYSLGGGKEVWPGYYQSVRPVMGWKVMLNVDTAATAFYTEQSVFDFLCTALRRKNISSPLSDEDRQRFSGRELREDERRQFSREIKGLRIVVSHLPYPRKYKVVDVTRGSTRQTTFPLEDGSLCTVEDYFRKKYPDSVITHPLLPCLHVGQKSRNVFLPIDVCKIVGGQRCMKKLTDMQTASMIKHTAKPAHDRCRIINEKVRNAAFHQDEVAKEFSMGIDTEMVSVPGRVLDPPAVTYKHRAVQPRFGAGSWDMRNGEKFYDGVEVKKWALIVCSRCNRSEYVNFVQKLQQKSGEMGMSLSNPLDCIEVRGRPIEKVFREVIRSYQSLDLIIAITDKGSPDYQEVKRLGDTTGGLGVATQCVCTNTVRTKCNPPTLGNICLKINARLGGINSIIDMNLRPKIIRQMPVIFFGADVTHPRSDDTTSPSIAAVVASMDLDGCRYRNLHRNQKHRKEIIVDLRSMVKDHLIQYRRATHYKPEKIIFYRDGVSEGQFEAVRAEEVAAIQGACLDLQRDGTYQPKITFIVVQKRHHTRLFPSSAKKEDSGRGGNVPPGTTVDRVITHPSQHDFYLCSHAAIQGTSRPCHYHVLWDDSDFSANDLQELSYQLCHVFWRCNRSVSYPAPTYYAHRAAFHARMLLQARQESPGYVDLVSTLCFFYYYF